MDDYKYFWFGLIGSMVVFVLCCIVGVIWGKCKSDGGRNGDNARGANAAARYRSTSNFRSYGGGYGGYLSGGIGDGGGFGGDSGGCGGDAGACGV